MIIIKWLKKVVLFLLNIFYETSNFIILRIKNVEYIDKPKINGRIVITGHGKITMGKGVKINSSLLSNPIGGDTRTILFVDKSAVINIGNNTGISNSTIVSKVSVSIGSNVRIGGNCRIYDTDFHSLMLEDRISDNDTDVKSKPVIIEDGVFIGAHSIILKGVVIGKMSIIGAGSIVTKSVPNGEIWAGNPAKFIRKL